MYDSPSHMSPGAAQNPKGETEGVQSPQKRTKALFVVLEQQWGGNRPEFLGKMVPIWSRTVAQRRPPLMHAVPMSPNNGSPQRQRPGGRRLGCWHRHRRGCAPGGRRRRRRGRGRGGARSGGYPWTNHRGKAWLRTLQSCSIVDSMSPWKRRVVDANATLASRGDVYRRGGPTCSQSALSVRHRPRLAKTLCIS